MTSYLLDTQIIIWLEESPQRLPERLRTIISDADSIQISSVSVWEMAIKIKTGKLSLPKQLDMIIDAFLSDYKAALMNVSLPHIYATQQLPLHHRDPFDRLLIAQSIVESIPVISSDAAFDAYGINRIW